MRDQSSSRTRRGRAQSMRECHAHSPEECPRQDAALARPTRHSVALRIPRGRPSPPHGGTPVQRGPGCAKKKRADGTDDATPGGAPLAPPACNIGHGWGCFRGAKKEPIPFSHTAGFHAPNPMLQMGFKRGHTAGETRSAPFFALPGMAVNRIRLQLSVMTCSSRQTSVVSRAVALPYPSGRSWRHI